MLFIIGVGRSGTNLLADALAQEPGYINTVENRYIWNYGADRRSDVRVASELNPRVSQFIKSSFMKMPGSGSACLIDKTPSNVFRMEFIAAIFPESKFIHIIRDGRDNVLSRMREWAGGNFVVASQRRDGFVETVPQFRRELVRGRIQHLRAILARGNLPPSRIPVFLLDNGLVALHHMISQRPKRYGERFPGMDQFLFTYGQLSTCAVQWREGVMQALSYGRRMPEEQYLEVRYEDLLENPKKQWRRINSLLGGKLGERGANFIEINARRGSSRDWSSDEYRSFIGSIEPHIRPTSEFLGYGWT